jgi:signal peptidase I
MKHNNIFRTIFPGVVSSIFLAIVICVIILKIFFIESHIVVSDSMSPTLIEGDRLICWRLDFTGITDSAGSAKHGGLNRNDIVVFKLDGESDFLIKRVIGLPGETVELKADGIFIDGAKISEEYSTNAEGFPVYRKFELASDAVIVLGDHRGSSRDSREFGAVPLSAIKEKVLFRFFPFERFGAVK